MLWGSIDGREVQLVTLKTECLEVDICSLGAALVSVRLKVKGEWLDVVLGYESLERYVNGGKPNFGTVVGRCANRIANGTFELDGQQFKLDTNNGSHHLHGGTKGFYAQVFDVASASEKQVTLVLTEPDGFMGYPGKVEVSVTYEVSGGELHFRYSGLSDKPTLLSMTNHAYWNLKGHKAGNVLDHILMVPASRTTATDDSLAITGELPEVAGTSLDLREPRLLQEAVNAGGPIDRNYCLDRPDGQREMMAARLVGPNKVTMEVWTDQPGLQVFTGSNIGTTGPGTWWNGKVLWRMFARPGLFLLRATRPRAVSGRSSVQSAWSRNFGRFITATSKARFCDRERRTAIILGMSFQLGTEMALMQLAGLYDDLVLLLDFNSLYPSIIQEYNICFTTVDRPDENEVAKMTSEAQLLSQTREPDGTAEEGILPQVLRRLVDSRRVVKASMKSEKNPKILQVLEIRQKALKLTANSMYGCLGFQNSRFHAKPLAALITAKGREALQSTKTVVQQELQLEVVYGDTDSVFVNSKTADFHKAMHVAEQIKRAVNKRYRRLEIEIDAVFVRLMLLKKKKYAALKVVNWEKELFEQELKGLDIVRRDWCGLAKEMGEAILTKILDPKMNKEESIDWVHQFLSEQAKNMDGGQVPLDKFVITKGLTKDPKDYPDAKKQPHVQVALRLLSRGKQVRPGQEIGYVVCDTAGEGHEGKSLLAERARDPHEMELDPTLRLDMTWYKKHQVHPIIARILGVVEGTSPGRIAECLGMDAAIFAQVVQHEEGEGLDFISQYMDADPNALFDRSLRYKNFGSILDGVKCKKCGGRTPWQQLLTPSATGEEAQQAPPFTCKDCHAQIQPGAARNQWHQQLRRLVKQHCEGWVQPADQVAGTEKTRRANKGDNLVSEQTVRKELQFAAHLCESAGLRIAEEDAALQTALARMKKDADAWMKIGSQHFIDCGQWFGAIFGTPLLGTLHQ
ncbi:unnamed protein product [Symbiodinium sp. CCMP2592]|nr:unnamed protein product [Symbiodinium sp. CCMP2592]